MPRSQGGVAERQCIVNCSGAVLEIFDNQIFVLNQITRISLITRLNV